MRVLPPANRPAMTGGNQDRGNRAKGMESNSCHFRYNAVCAI